jgi:hypothetical protein
VSRHQDARGEFSEVCPCADYTDDEREFLQAMDRFKRSHNRPYPTWREVLGVLRSLGYAKAPPPAPPPPPVQ